MPKLVYADIPKDTDTVGVQNAPRPKSGPKLIYAPLDTNPKAPEISPDTVQQFNKQPGPDYYNMSLNALPMIGGILGDIAGSVALPGAGTIPGGIIGAGAGSFAKQALSKEPSITGGLEDTALQGVIPSLVGKGLSFIPKIAAKFSDASNPFIKKTLNSTIEGFTKPNQPILDMSGKLSEDIPPYRVAPTGPTGALGDYMKGKAPQKVIDKLLSDPREIDSWIAQTGEPHSVEQLALNNAVSKGYNGTSGAFDPDKILTELGSKETYKQAIQPEVMDRLTTFLNKAKQFDVPTTSGLDSMLRYAKHRLIFSLAAGGAGGAVAGEYGAGSALILGNVIVTKLMQSDLLGKLALKALETPTNSQISPLLTKSILAGLRGTIAYMQTPDGKQTPVQIGKDGAIQPLNQ